MAFITLDRDIQQWPLWRRFRADQRQVVVQLLFMANWASSWMWDGKERVEIKRGQLAHSEETIANETGVGRKVVRTVLDQLEADGFLARSMAGRFRIISIVNYDHYQSQHSSAGQSTGRVTASPRPAPGQRWASREQEEQDQQEELKDLVVASPPTPAEEPKKARKEPTGPAADCYRYWRDDVWPQLSGDPYPDTQADHVLLAQKLKKATPVAIRLAMDRYAHDEFWSGKLDLKGFLAKLPVFLATNSQKPTGPPRLVSAEKRQAEADFYGWLKTLPDESRRAYWRERESAVLANGNGGIAAVDAKYREQAQQAGGMS